jgi:hypothetical protein
VVLCLAVFKANAIANLSSKAILSHPSNPFMFLMGKLMGYMLKYSRNNNLFFILCYIKSRETKKPKIYQRCSFESVFTYIYQESSSQTTKICSVRFFRYKSLYSLHSETTKVCTVRFFIAKFCTVRFLRLQIFVVSTN